MAELCFEEFAIAAHAGVIATINGPQTFWTCATASRTSTTRTTDGKVVGELYSTPIHVELSCS